MNWLKARLNEPSTHTAIAILLTLGTTVAPAADRPYVIALAGVLAALGFVLPEGVNARVQAAAK